MERSIRTRSRIGDRAFAAAGPRVWNSLSVRIRQPDLTLGKFYWSLKYAFLSESPVPLGLANDVLVR